MRDSQVPPFSGQAHLLRSGTCDSLPNSATPATGAGTASLCGTMRRRPCRGLGRSHTGCTVRQAHDNSPWLDAERPSGTDWGPCSERPPWRSARIDTRPRQSVVCAPTAPWPCCGTVWKSRTGCGRLLGGRKRPGRRPRSRSALACASSARQCSTCEPVLTEIEKRAGRRAG